eukprot:jgi/Chlat1/1071/Chrsp110S08635
MLIEDASPCLESISASGDAEVVSEVQQRLADICAKLGIHSCRFKRVPANYYNQSLESRREALSAPTVEHLCKSIVMTNTQAPPEVTDCSDPEFSKYYIIIIQYAARLNAEKVKAFIHSMNNGKVSKKRINMRLAPEEMSAELTGFEHNAVTPIGTKTPIPVMLSDRIARLQPASFWMGAGVVDLKMRVDVAEFVKAYRPFVIDCTYDE